MFTDFLADFFKFIFLTCAAIFMLFSLPFVLLHVAEHWNDDEYPHSGFTPDCPTWEAPENTLPPTSERATRRAPRGEF